MVWTGRMEVGGGVLVDLEPVAWDLVLLTLVLVSLELVMLQLVVLQPVMLELVGRWILRSKFAARLRTDLRLQLWLLCLAGAWAPRRGASSTSASSQLYSAYSGCVVVILLLFVASLLLAMVHYWGHMLGVTMNACLMFVYLMNVVKIIALLKMQPSAEKLITELDRCMQEYGRALGADKAAVFQWTALKSRIVSVARILVALSGCLYWAVVPAARTHACGGTVQCRDSVGLPAHVWYPFSFTQTPVYEVVYTLVAGGLLCGALISCIVDAFFVSLIIYQAAHLQLLNLMLVNVCGPQGEAEPGLAASHDQKRREAAESADVEGEMRRRLAECVCYHCDIDSCVQHLSSLLGPIILGQFLMDMVTISATAFVAIANNADSNWLVKYMSYLSSVIQQLLLYCWFGTDIITQSERLQMSAYSSDWVVATPRFGRELRIFLCRAHRPLRLTASKFYTISRDTFLLLMNASLSYFAVLREISNK
ncbi:odorant receptor 82a-like [Schistocerca serialis cubense]|uniref:odorant receptor 82a-like n=1 Tax=Schistocerca serialis cubense TaxID=2023355 RepID=UPI00214E9FC9|nr:odorant receptor 82a-like [Schistocerca serialis cubense]